MAKLGKVILFSAVVGAAAAGVYHLLQKKNDNVDEFEDFDDFDDLDDFDEEEKKTDDEKRNYVSLDSAKSIVSDGAAKAKDAVSKVGKKIKSTIDDAKAKKEEVKEDAATDTEETAEAEKSTEEFFDDDEA